MKDNSGLNQNDDDGAGEKWLESGPVLQVEPRKLDNVLAANSEEKKKGRVIHWILAWTLVQMIVPFTEEDKKEDGQVLM